MTIGPSSEMLPATVVAVSVFSRWEVYSLHFNPAVSYRQKHFSRMSIFRPAQLQLCAKHVRICSLFVSLGLGGSPDLLLLLKPRWHHVSQRQCLMLGGLAVAPPTARRAPFPYGPGTEESLVHLMGLVEGRAGEYPSIWQYYLKICYFSCRPEHVWWPAGMFVLSINVQRPFTVYTQLCPSFGHALCQKPKPGAAEVYLTSNCNFHDEKSRLHKFIRNMLCDDRGTYHGHSYKWPTCSA